jgi:diacylglycerol kinase (ATP)
MTTNQAAKRVLVIINPAAGRGQPVLHTLNHVFADTDIEWEIAVTKRYGDAGEAARAAAADMDVIAVYGGDGTVMEVANALHGTEIPMAVLPGGTANVLAAELNIPRDLEQAVRLITDPPARTCPVDMGEIDGQLFFHLSIGILGDLANRTDRAAKDHNGLLAYLLSGLKELEQLPDPTLFRLTLDGKESDVEGIGCMVTNLGKIGIADLRLAHDINLSDGAMDVMVIRDVNLSTLVKTLGEAITSGEIANALWRQRAKEVSISVPSKMHAMLDGEPFESASESFVAHIIPGAVTILVPFDASSE